LKKEVVFYSMKAILTIITLTILLYSCSKNKYGCTDSNAINFDANVTNDDGSCVFPEWRDDLIGLYLVIDSSRYYNTSSNMWATNIKIDTVELKKGIYFNEMILVEKGITLIMAMPDSTLSSNSFGGGAKESVTSSGTFKFPFFYFSIVRNLYYGNLSPTLPRWIIGEKIM
jgi:hypothetical protein